MVSLYRGPPPPYEVPVESRIREVSAPRIVSVIVGIALVALSVFVGSIVAVSGHPVIGGLILGLGIIVGVITYLMIDVFDPSNLCNEMFD